MTEFTGFPVAALDFYDDLEVDNTKSFWKAHQETYNRDVKAPMVALCAALAPEFGDAKASVLTTASSGLSKAKSTAWVQ